LPPNYQLHYLSVPLTFFVMPLLMLRKLPRYECLREAAERNPVVDPSACEAFLNLLRTSDLAAAAEKRALAEFGLGQGRYLILMILGHDPATPMKSSELADELGVSRATTTGLLDSLERDAWIRREHDVEDRRVTRIWLTDSGKEVTDRLVPAYFSCVARVMNPLDAKERSQLVGLLQKLQSALSDDFPNESDPEEELSNH